MLKKCLLMTTGILMAIPPKKKHLNYITMPKNLTIFDKCFALDKKKELFQKLRPQRLVVVGQDE
jgi:hypothetical protein